MHAGSRPETVLPTGHRGDYYYYQTAFQGLPYPATRGRYVRWEASDVIQYSNSSPMDLGQCGLDTGRVVSPYRDDQQ